MAALPPARLRARVIHLPSGEYEEDIHCVAPPVAWVSWRRPVPSGLTVYLLLETISGPSTLEVKRMRRPSGDQSGWSPARRAHGVMRRALRPSTFATKSATLRVVPSEASTSR